MTSVANKKIRYALVDTGLTKRALANRLGISPARLSQLLRYEMPENEQKLILAAIVKETV